MDSLQKPLNLKLWLNADLIQQQNLLKMQFSAVLEAVGNSFSQVDFQKISEKSKGVKVSKGNDLLGFPYQVLDLIRDFDSATGANVRLLNWFGNGLYVTILLGKNWRNPIEEFLSLGFSFGLSENQWDYPDLILNKNQTTEISQINGFDRDFYHWIMQIEVDPEPTSLKLKLTLELKKILAILSISQEQSGN